MSKPRMSRWDSRSPQGNLVAEFPQSFQPPTHPADQIASDHRGRSPSTRPKRPRGQYRNAGLRSRARALGRTHHRATMQAGFWTHLQRSAVPETKGRTYSGRTQEFPRDMPLWKSLGQPGTRHWDKYPLERRSRGSPRDNPGHFPGTRIRLEDRLRSLVAHSKLPCKLKQGPNARVISETNWTT